MLNIIHHTSCPLCDSTDISFVFETKDYTVSGQQFSIWQCRACTARFTQDIPDEQSIGAFYQSSEYVSHSNTNKGIVNNLYHRVRKITLESKRKLVSAATSKAAGRLLDIGSGVGAFASHMKDAGWKVTALEPDEVARKNALQQFAVESQPSETLFTLPNGSFDAITMWHVLEHVHDLHAYLDRIQDLLTGDGKILIAVPNYTSGDAGKYKEHWAAYDVPRHLYHFTPASMKKLLQLHKFSLVDMQPMWFDSFYVSLLSEKYRSGRSSLVGGFLAGLTSNAAALVNKAKTSSLIYIAGKS